MGSSYRAICFAKQALRPAALIAMVCLSSACSSLTDPYYVVATDGLQRNYYRVTIRGTAKLTSGEFQAGQVNADVIDRLFGDFATELFGESDGEPDTGARVELFDPATGESSSELRMVIVLSSDPEIIFAQLKSLADTKAVSSAVTGLVLERERAENRRLQTELDETSRYSVLLAAQLQEALTNLGAPDATTSILLRELLATLGE